MTLCNMAIEAGARCGIVAVDEKTIEYMKGRPLAPEGKQWEHAVEYWKTLHSDEGANFDTVIEINASGNSSNGYLGYFSGNGRSDYWLNSVS